ncbi:polysaccharide biosynthesis C-terminal domain-containing protein, partial [Staphylococcus aureus]|uniref:polysaccharide biosynthesis C-terminal domain-containing protein n=1 Tax=Staphylococcus aureus TaxID=1280 RepID=UPI00301DB31E
LAAVYFLVVLSGCFAWILMYLLDEKSYGTVQYLLSICILAPLLYTLSEVTGVGIQIVKKTKLSMYASIFALIINAMGNYFLIPILGAAGAAVSTAVSFLVFFILRTEFSNKVWRKRGYGKVYLVLFFLLTLTASSAFLGADLPGSI